MEWNCLVAVRRPAWLPQRIPASRKPPDVFQRQNGLPSSEGLPSPDYGQLHRQTQIDEHVRLLFDLVELRSRDATDFFRDAIEVPGDQREPVNLDSDCAVPHCEWRSASVYRSSTLQLSFSPVISLEIYDE